MRERLKRLAGALRVRRKKAGRLIAQAFRAVAWADVLQWAAILGGWALLTWGIASLLVWEVWPISAGMLLLSIAGWGHLRVLFANGLYALFEEDRRAKDADVRPLRRNVG